MQVAHSSASPVQTAGRGGRLAAYLTVLAVGSGARVFGLASQFVVLIMLSRILSKDSFGDLMTAFGFYRIGAAALGVGASLVLLYHVSRRPDDRAAEIRLHRYSAVLGAAVAAVIALAGFMLAGPVAHALAKPGLAAWFRELAPFAIFSTLLTTSTGALEGRSRISESIALADVVPNAVRIVLLPAVAWFALPDAYVAHALTLSVLVPWLWSGRRLWDRSVRGWRPWTRWDVSYCGKFVAATLFANQLGAVDILVAGVLFPSGIVADYALAARIAALYSFFQLALLKRFAPRAARMIETKDWAALRQEVAFCRKLLVGCGALTIAGILCVAPFLLPLFGNYAGAWAFLVWLAIPTFIQSFYEAADRLLIIAGQANVPLAITASSFCVLVVTPFLTAPLLGPTAIAAAMAVASFLFYPVAAVRVRRMFGLTTIHPLDMLMMVAGIAALAAYAASGAAIAGAASVAVLAAIALYCCASAIRRTGP
jgi:O-antigen/teichoic acid export membrane protein